jgi:hypothetical protein
VEIGGLDVESGHLSVADLDAFRIVTLIEATIGMVGTFAGLAVGLPAEVETLQQPANQFLTGDEAPLGQRRGEMALAVDATANP